MFRLYGAGVVCAANVGLSGNASLVLDNVTLAAIFEKTITSWDNSAILALSIHLLAVLSLSLLFVSLACFLLTQ